MVNTRVLNTANTPSIVDTVVQVLQSGGVIVYPTETVYGIGCSIFNSDAVADVYRIKARPFDMPLSANLANIEQVYEIAVDIPDEFFLLAERFLPGPLSIIIKKSWVIPNIVTSGLDSVAIRIPDNKIFHEIIESLDMPVAGTSANISGKGSVAEISELLDTFVGKVDIIINDGSSRIGIESTIISLIGDKPRIIRTGAISKTDIELCLRRKIL
jgi:L-threonylcarbamoyladenylate synthase